MHISLSIFYCFLLKKNFKLNDKTQRVDVVLIIDSHSHTNSHINNTLSVCLTNQMLEKSLILLFFNH